MSEKVELLVYGANGYTGKLICEQLKKLNQKFVVAGRNEIKTKEIADQYSVPYKIFSLDKPEAVAEALRPVSVVIHCAGPYSVTSKPMLDGCIKAKTHYLDITGEYTVIEAIAARDEEIRAAGILAMPSVGMDVVPSDCIAAHAAGRLPSATNLTLYIRSTGGALSAGTAKTMVETIGDGSKIRSEGVITKVPFGEYVEEMTFPDGTTTTLVNFPWGDVSSAYYTTNIPNIKVFMAAMPPRAAKVVNWISPILNLSLVKWGLQTLAGRYVKGSDLEARDSSHTEFIAIASDGETQVKSYLKTINGYSLTAISSVDIAQRVLKGDFKAGFFTPAGLYGADLVLDVPGSIREEL